ncbi:MAG: NUDIX hydrolase [Planctomycetia bacterium]|nr:NUDIX hydrolase [Planctomycetia bacterium]
MNSSGPRDNRIDLAIQKMIGLNRAHPVTTQQVRVAFENAQLRVEHNLVRNAATFEETLALCIALPDEAQCVAVTIPVLSDGRLLLLGRYRYPVGRWSIEFPRAMCQTIDSGWRQPAEENLLKDAGLQADNWRLLGAVQVDPALMSTSALVILAEDCAGLQEKAFDDAELIAGSVALTGEELDELVRRGEVVCGVTLAALCLYRAQLQAR